MPARQCPPIATLGFVLAIGDCFFSGASIDLWFWLGLCLLARMLGHGLALQFRTAPVAMLAPPRARRSRPGGAATSRRPSAHTAMLALVEKSSGLGRDNDFSTALVRLNGSTASRSQFEQLTPNKRAAGSKSCCTHQLSG